MCTTDPGAVLAGAILLVVLPFGLVPIAAAVWAWRRPTRGRATLAAAAAVVPLGLLAVQLLLSDPSAFPPDAAYRFREAVMARAMPVLLLGAALAWGAHGWRAGPPLRHAGLALAALALAASLAYAGSMVVDAAGGCENPPPPPGPTS